MRERRTKLRLKTTPQIFEAKGDPWISETEQGLRPIVHPPLSDDERRFAPVQRRIEEQIKNIRTKSGTLCQVSSRRAKQPDFRHGSLECPDIDRYVHAGRADEKRNARKQSIIGPGTRKKPTEMTPERRMTNLFAAVNRKMAQLRPIKVKP